LAAGSFGYYLTAQPLALRVRTKTDQYLARYSVEQLLFGWLALGLETLEPWALILPLSSLSDW
jgi:hypothetical protein